MGAGVRCGWRRIAGRFLCWLDIDQRAGFTKRDPVFDRGIHVDPPLDGDRLAGKQAVELFALELEDLADVAFHPSRVLAADHLAGEENVVGIEAHGI